MSRRGEQRELLQGLRLGLKHRLAEFDPLVDMIQEMLLLLHNDHEAMGVGKVDTLMAEARKMGVVCRHVPTAGKDYHRRKSGGTNARQDIWGKR